MSSSQKYSHRNSGQNGPVDKFTALTATIFVTISVFVLGPLSGIFLGSFFVLGALVARIGRKPLCRDTFFCPDARILPGYCPDTIHQSVWWSGGHFLKKSTKLFTLRAFPPAIYKQSIRTSGCGNAVRWVCQLGHE